ncbi:MAG: hypothetical protein Q8M15_07095 [Bacteroidota bacterium]|nr:hypothetical protein [Bacteroidota bacterium]
MSNFVYNFLSKNLQSLDPEKSAADLELFFQAKPLIKPVFEKYFQLWLEKCYEDTVKNTNTIIPEPEQEQSFDLKRLCSILEIKSDSYAYKNIKSSLSYARKKGKLCGSRGNGNTSKFYFTKEEVKSHLFCYNKEYYKIFCNYLMA